MASPSERSSSSSRSTASLMPGRIVIACDATRNHSLQEFKGIITNIRMRGSMIQEVDTITVLGVLHKVLHPMGFQMQIGPDSFIGTRSRAMKEEVSRKVDAYVGMLQKSAEECEGDGVRIEVKIVVGAPITKVVVQEAAASNATWVVLDRHLKKEVRFYLKHIACKVALLLDNLSLEVLRPNYSDKATYNVEHKRFHSLSKLVPQSPSGYNNEQSIISPSYRLCTSSQESSDSDKSSLASSLTSISKEQYVFSPEELGSNHQLEKSGSYAKATKSENDNAPQVMQEQRSPRNYADFPLNCNEIGINLEQDSLGCKHLEIIQAATDALLSDKHALLGRERDDSDPVTRKERNMQLDYDVPLVAGETKMGLYSRGCSYSEIQIATNDFSSENFLGEDGYGLVYKGQLKDEQLISVKVQKKANAQGLQEFHSDIHALSFVCHKNIVMLLGYCCKEILNILVYEYICNKSLAWHLFDDADHVLEWHQRHAIAIGIAKGIRFLHEECRGSPIIHRDIRPSNILLTHEFVPLLGDCGLAKWKTNKYDTQTEILGNLEYLAPEYAENGTCSVKTDIFAFGIVLIQLISGRKALDSVREDHHQSLRQWALPLIQTVELHELVDPRLGDSYSTYQLYQMARAAYLCLQSKPALRPTIEEVLHLLQGKNDHLHRQMKQLIPDLDNIITQASLVEGPHAVTVPLHS